MKTTSEAVADFAAVREDWHALRLVPDVEKTAEMCAEAVRQCGLALHFVPDRLKTPELCMAAVKWDEGFLDWPPPRGGALEDVPERLKTPELCAEAVRLNPRALRWVPEALKTQELCALALAGSPWALQDVPEELRTPDVCMQAVLAGGPLTAVPEALLTRRLLLAAVRKRGWALQFIPEKLKTPEICAAAAETWPPAAEPASGAGQSGRDGGDGGTVRTPEEWTSVVAGDGLSLRLVPDALKTEEMCLAAVKSAPAALEWVPEALKTDGVCAAAAGYPMVFRFLPERAKTPEVCAVAVSLSASALQFVPEALKTPELCMAAVMKMPGALEFVPEALRTEELCLASVRRPEDESLGMFWDPQDSPAALQFVPERFRTERLCAEAVGADWRAMQFVPDRLKTPAFCLRAVRESPKALAFVPEALRTEELCHEAIRLGGGDVLEFVPRRLLPENAFLDAVVQDGMALEHVPDALKTPELCMLAVRNSAYALAFEHVPDRLKTADMCLEAVRGSGYVAFGQTPPELRSEEIVWINEEGHFRGVRISGWSPEWPAPDPAREAASLRPGPLAALTETILLGLAVGDATGVPYEFMKRGTFKAKPMQGGGGHGQPAGTWSDDTALALAFADALLPGGFDAEQAGRNFQDWLYKGKFTARGNVFDVGRGTAAAIARMKDGVLPEACGGRERQENGNGSLMRIAPVVPALLAVSDPERRWDIVRRASSLTHAHPLSCLCCFVFEEFLRLLCLGRSRDFAYADLCIAFADAGFGGLKKILSGLRGFGRLSRVLGGRLPELPEAEIRSGGFVVDTLEASLWCLLNSDSYAEAVLKAASLGRDADTTACVAGATAALCWGRDSIPAEWIEGLAGRDELLRIARKAAEQIQAGDGEQ